MADTVEFSITGLDSLLGKLDAIAFETKRKGGRAALRKAAQLVANAARENAQRLNDPDTKNDISKNIAVRWSGSLFQAKGDLGFRVGVLGGAKLQNNYHTRRGRTAQMYEVGGDYRNPGGDTFYWRYLEFGTEKIAAQPFMRTALSSNIDAATKTFVSEYEKAIDRAIRRAAKKKVPS